MGKMITEAGTGRDRLWCRALIAVLDTEDIGRVTAEFNRIRPDTPAEDSGKGKEVSCLRELVRVQGKLVEVLFMKLGLKPSTISTPATQCVDKRDLKIDELHSKIKELEEKEVNDEEKKSYD